MKQALWLLPPAAAGAFLRLFNLRHQVLAGDELHGVRAALSKPVGEILVTYQVADPCLPLAAFYRLLMDWDVIFSETTFRLPVLAASIASLALIPWLVRKHVGWPTALVFAWWLALSPMMVLYGRIARPYGIVLLLALAAVLAFYRFLEKPSWAAGLAYALPAAAAVWFHLGTAAFAAAPFAFALAAKLLARDTVAARWRDLGALGLGALAAVASFAVPARESLARFLGTKSGASGFKASTLVPVAEMQAGTAWAPAAVLFWLAVAGGLAVLLLRRRRFALYTVTLALVHLGSLAAASPFGVFSPVILNRYLLVLTPLFLLWGSAALVLPWRRDRGGRGESASPGRARLAAAGAFLALLFTAGPAGDAAYRQSVFLHHDDFVRLDSPRAALPAEAIPAFFNRLGEEGDSGDGEHGAVLHFPFRTSWRFARVPYVLEAVHGRRVLVSPPGGGLCDPRLALTSCVCPRPEAFLASPARFLVVHLDLPAEEARVENVHAARDLRNPEGWRAYARQGRQVAKRLRREWGPPAFADPRVAVWDLGTVRAEFSRPKTGS